jgi:uncharacterized protein (TIGR00369 family)
MLTHTLDELQQYYLQMVGIDEPRPGILSIKECSDERIVAVTLFDDTHVRDGGVVSGPSLFSVVDAIGLLLTLANSPKGSNGFTSALSIQFLRPVPIGEVRVEGRLLRYGRKSCVVDATVFCDQQDQPVAQGVVTFVHDRPKDAGWPRRLAVTA